MPSVMLKFVGDGDGVWPDLAKKEVHHTTEPIQIAVLEGGMTSGKPSVSMRIDLDDGAVVLFETSLVVLLSVADALRAKYGDPRE